MLFPVIAPPWPITTAVERRVQEELVRQAKQGDAEAFDSLARLVGDRCLAIAVRILRDVDLAEDAVQTALITAWTELRSLRDASRFEPWLHRILTNACYAEAGRRRRWSEGLKIVPVAGASPDDYLTVDDRDLLERAFRRLTVQQRAVLVFHHYLGLSISEVAVRTGLPLGTAKSRLHHATRALRASIEADARATASSQERLA
jgi:RNA polymerase sigma-70 factor (ECF subfamily)